MREKQLDFFKTREEIEEDLKKEANKKFSKTKGEEPIELVEARVKAGIEEKKKKEKAFDEFKKFRENL